MPNSIAELLLMVVELLLLWFARLLAIVAQTQAKMFEQRRPLLVGAACIVHGFP